MNWGRSGKEGLTWGIMQGVGAGGATFKVNGAISIHVGLTDDLGDLPGGELLSQKPLHGLLQLSQGDLTISIGVKLLGAEG